MEKTRRYEFEGIALEVPLRYDPLSGLYIEEYPDFREHPVYTGEGCPVLFVGEDACPYGEPKDGGTCPDCGACRYFRPAGPHTWIGVCSHAKWRYRRGPESGGPEQERIKRREENEDMEERTLCEITLTGTENGEWQGTVYVPALDKRYAFQSLLELIRTVEHQVESTAQIGKRTEN